MQRTLFLFLILVLNQLPVFAQNNTLLFRNITRNNGLPVDEVTTLAQDSTGFIWIGTLEGLFRYDGFNFKAFSFDNRHNIGTSVTKILVDRSGKLWVASVDGGISCISASGEVIRVVNSSSNKLVTETGNYVTDIKQDRFGNIWWTSTDGLFCIDTNNNIRCFKIQTPYARGNSFNHISFDAQGRAWVAGYLGLQIFDPQSKQFKPAGDNDAERTFFAKRRDISAIAFYRNIIWYSNWNPELGMFRRQEGRPEIVYSGLGSAQPDFNRMANTFYTDQKGVLWIGTGRGLYRMRTPAAAIEVFKHDAGNNFSLVNDWVTAILEDREGNFWMATKRGISVIQPYAPPVNNLSSNNLSLFPFGNKEVTDIIEAGNNHLLIGTQNADGMYQTDLQFKMQKHWNYHRVGYDWIWNHFEDKPRERIFISTQEGMLIYDQRTGPLAPAKDSIFKSFFPVSSFVATSDSIVWMTRFYSKLLKYNLHTGAFKIFDITRMGEKPQVVFLSKDNNNRLWIMAHQSGLWRFDEQTERIVERIEKTKDSASLKESTIFCFLDLGASYLVGYLSKGISLYDKKTKTFRHYTKEHGLASNIVRDVVLAKDGTVWIATKNGLSQFDPAKGNFRNYNYETGILQNDFLCITQLKDGRIAAGSTMGMVCLDPGKPGNTVSVSKPIITEISIYGKTLAYDAAGSHAPIDIGYGDNYFSFEYISLHYSHPQQVEYAYRLEGLDEHWIPAGTRRFVSYSGVPGGHYTFRVRARLPNGPWVETIAPVKLFVQTAFYKRWWFYVLCVLSLAALMFIAFRYRLQQVIKLEKMRAAISSDLHDEVGASLTSISLFSEMARQATLPESKKEEFLQRIGERSRDSIEQMSDIIWSINPENDSLQQMLVRMKNYAAELTEAKDIQFQWTQEGNFAQSRLSMEQRKNFYLFFKEAVNNAVKHAGSKNIRIRLAVHAHLVRLHITDDGIGFNAGQNGNGNGLKNMQRRTDQLQGRVNISSANGKGTTIELQFPY